MNAQEYNLNIRPGYGYSQTVKVSQDDIGRPLEFHLYDGMDLLSITVGSVITIHATKPSGLGFTETCTWSGSTASISTTESMTQESGAFPAELVITSGDDVLGTANFTFCVERSPHQTGTTDGVAEDLQDIYEQLDDLKEDIENISGISDDVKLALMAVVNHVAWDNTDGQQYIDALEEALYAEEPKTLVSISAVYTQSGTVYDTDSLDSLKADLVVTAHYDDSTTATVIDYVLSGTLTDGTSTITVTYEGKTTTFTVTVTANTPLYPLTNGEYTFSGNYHQKITVTNGNHIKIEYPNGDPYSQGSLLNISTLSKNGSVSTSNQSAVNNLSDVLFTIPAGATAKLEAKNFTPSRANLFMNETHKQFVINARKTGASTSALTTIGFSEDVTADTFVSEKVMTENTDISCFFVYELHIITGITVEFDLELTVDGRRWI